MAYPLDAKEYLDNIVGEDAGKSITEEYLKRRGLSNIYNPIISPSTSNLHAYVKPRSDETAGFAAKKLNKSQKETIASTSEDILLKNETFEPQTVHTKHQGNSKKKKTGKVVSLAEAAKGSIVYQKGKPCSCQACRHKLISNCLSCGKIVCEQEGEGRCHFCGALVLREGSTYAGLDEVGMPMTDAEAAAEAFAKRLVEYGRDSAARTTVIDEIEGNCWLSMEEKELLSKKREEVEEAERAKRSKVVMTFDMLGRKVLLNDDDLLKNCKMEIFSYHPRRDEIRIKLNRNIKIQPFLLTQVLEL